MSDDYHLVVFDPPGVQSLIYQTSKLKEIQAASARLETAMEATLSDMALEFKARTLFQAGGGGAFFVPGDRADAFRTKLRRALAQTLPGMPFVVGPEPAVVFTDSAKETQDHAEQARWPQLSELEASPLFGPAQIGCASCRFAPATVQFKGEKNLYLCAHCESKRNGKETSRFRKALSELAPKHGWNTIEDKDFAQDLIDLSEESHTRKGYLAVLLFDGNGMGQHFKDELEKVKSPDDCAAYKTKSDALRDKMVHVFAEAVLQTWPNGFKDSVPADMLYLGGDDAAMVCAPDRALQLAVNAAQLFEMRFAADKFTLAIGLVFARHNTPMRTMLDLAQNLNTSAKKLHQFHKIKDKGKNLSSLDFHVLLGQSMDDLETYRLNNYGLKDEYTAAATARPYTIDEISHLPKEVARLAPLAGRIWDLVDASTNLQQGELAAIQLLGRMCPKEAAPLSAHFEQSSLGTMSDLPPWFKPTAQRPKPYMVLRDALELMPFLEVNRDDHGT